MTGVADEPGPEPGPAQAIRTSIVVPAYNEAARLDGAMERLREAVDSGAVDPAHVELIVVDDGSTDRTRERAGELVRAFPYGAVVSLDANRGKGAAVRAGVAHSRGAVIAFMDADMSIDPDQLPLLVGALDAADIAIGSRAVPGASAAAVHRQRAVMGRAFNRALNAVTDIELRDTQCGFKAFRAATAKLLFHCTLIERFAFDVEVLYLARRFGFRIAEVPVRWAHVGNSRIRPITDSWSVAVDIARRRFGRRRPPPVEALVIGERAFGPAVDETALRRCVGAGHSVARCDDDTLLVLMPLAGPEEVPALAERIAEAMPGVLPRRTALSLAQLFELPPPGLAGAAAPAGSARGTEVAAST